uniref:TTF-type domain-containing protein n=1 Tax=Sphaeramia orbicularis TaxID=375764 RepID=A0A672Y3A4_9TELE
MKRSKPSGAQYRKRRKEEANTRSFYHEHFLQLSQGAAAEGTSAPTSTPLSEESGEGTSRAGITIQPPQDTPSTATRPYLLDFSKEAPLDPADWPNLSEVVRMEIASRGPSLVKPDFIFPKREDGRSCHHHYFSRRLVNGEKIKRSWLVYSIKRNSLFCFCCKLFSLKSFKLINGGLNDWKNCSELLKSHENSPEHSKNMTQWKELETRIDNCQTIDKTEMSLIDAERKRWREVLTRLVAIIQSLAERNITFRGTTETLHQPNNGNFLKEVELMAQFDPVMKEHVAKVVSGDIHISYLGKNIQNELIDCIGGKIVESMVAEIKQSKYFSIILDCTTDLKNKEQLSVIIRIVAVEDTPQIKEHFIGFLEEEESTGESLSTLILKRLEELDIPFEDCRGQFYENGANLKGKRKGVQTRLLKINPRALYVPCGAHTVNLMVADAAKSSTDATGYFGYLQKLFTLFSTSTQRWSILRKHLNTTLRSWSDTRWESRISSVKAVRYQAAEVRDALLEVRDNTTDPVIKTEAQSLAEEVGSYRFSICTVVWYDILTKIQHVHKLLQLETMQVDLAVHLLKKTEASLLSYRDTGFASAQVSAREMCEEMNVEAFLKPNGLRTTRRQFSYEAPDEKLTDALKKMETSFFNVVVDESIVSLQERSQALGEVEKKFSVLVNFPDLPSEELKKQCEILSNTLSCSGQSDLDGTELALELQAFPDLPEDKTTTLELLKFLQEKNLKEVYPNMWVALRIAVTLPVTAAAVERSFSKLKLKTYLRSTMSEERFNGLGLISINRDVSRQVSIDETIDAFAAKKSRRVQF